MSAPRFQELRFSTDASRASELVRFVVAGWERRPSEPARILDIGCGTGITLAEFAATWPTAELCGVDLSPENIRTAQAALPAGSRGRLICGDYLQLAEPPFDLVVADSSLQLIAVPTPELLRKLGGDLQPGGLLGCSLPYDCWSNRVLYVIRRCLRALRCSPLESALHALARLWYGKRFPPAMLRERVAYCFLLPERMYGPELEADFARIAGLQLIGRRSAARFLGKPRSMLLLFAKTGL